jgi:hypothetical protein
MKAITQLLRHALTTLVVLASICRLSQAHASEALTDFGGAGPGGPWFGNDNTIGWEFEVLVPIQVTQLGLNSFGASAEHTLLQAHRIGIWDTSGNLLIHGTVGPGLADKVVGPWEYAAVNSTTLGLGRYVIGAQYVVGNTEWVVVAPTTTDPAVSFVAGRWGTGNDLPFPDQPIDVLWAGPNFQFNPVPEPSVALLLLVGIAVIGFKEYKRGKLPPNPLWERILLRPSGATQDRST